MCETCHEMILLNRLENAGVLQAEDTLAIWGRKGENLLIYGSLTGSQKSVRFFVAGFKFEN